MFSNGEVSEGYNKEEVITANKEFNSAEEDLAKFRYEELLDRLGIIEEDGEFISTSNKTIAETLQEELLRRDSSENVKDSLKLILIFFWYSSIFDLKLKISKVGKVCFFIMMNSLPNLTFIEVESNVSLWSNIGVIYNSLELIFSIISVFVKTLNSQLHL